MNVLKIFKEEKYMNMSFDNFVQYSPKKHREISLSAGTVTTIDYDKIYFRTVDCVEKVHWLGGLSFQRVDDYGYHACISDVDEEILNYINSRIRGV